jgi:hypothetical protein
MYDNTVWNLVVPLDGVKPIANKWVFKRKTDMDDNMTIYKARLVKVSNKFWELMKLFSPVAMFKSIRILLAIAAFHNYDYEIWQMDVKTAFLNGNLRRGCVHDTAYGF